MLVTVQQLTSLIIKKKKKIGKDLLLKLKALLPLKKEITVNFNKANTKFHLNLHYNSNSSYLLIKGNEIYEIKADNKKADSILSRKQI